jgi:uncharacterized protein YeaO (DUF488 family)
MPDDFEEKIKKELKKEAEEKTKGLDEKAAKEKIDRKIASKGNGHKKG